MKFLDCVSNNSDKLHLEEFNSRNKIGANKLIEAFKHLIGDLRLNWEDGKDKPAEEHILVSQTENDGSSKLESSETTNINAD